MITRDRQVRDATDAARLFSTYIPIRPVNIRGNSATVCCPFHNEKRPSFHVHFAGKRRGTFICFGCGVKGDVIDFVAMADGISHFEALKRLAAEAGIPMDAPAESPEQRRARREEKEAALWWYRKQWRIARGHINWALAAVPVIISYRESGLRSEPGWEPVIAWDLAGQIAETYGARLRWIESCRDTKAGLAAFRGPVSASEAKADMAEYRRWRAIEPEEKRWERLWMGLAKL